MKNIVAGILAHVDSGKTTLSEAMLYQAGQIRKLGRVDHQDTYLDTDSQEKDRGTEIPIMLQLMRPAENYWILLSVKLK